MGSLQYVAAIAAVAVALWPQLKQAYAYLLDRVPAPSPTSGRPSLSYTEAINHLASVRRRLIDTAALDEEQRKAIDVLTLALVDGSDQ